jgi:hypothetical protein
MEAWYSRVQESHGSRGGHARRGMTRARSWTGRAAMSRSTSSLVPSFVTAGAHRTRVSEMRPGSRAGRLCVAMQTFGSALGKSARRIVGVGRHQHRWST